jgi:hypothetical protein
MSSAFLFFNVATNFEISVGVTGWIKPFRQSSRAKAKSKNQ